ncbi:MAG: GNAT family N-acetyltransferase [Pirellulales bacterium]|nr:GNAT family N-acetyltransferase [Pirellulales bacterium]
MQATDRSAVAELILTSTNAWYRARGAGPIFPDGPTTTAVFFDVYEALDPGCGLVAQDGASGRLAGSCFYHPRTTHISLGIMNVHPDYFGRGVARALLARVVDYADGEEKPLRLVSSALNLDSFSLYNHAGFVPRAIYQDMVLHVPDGGFEPARCQCSQHENKGVSFADHAWRIREGRPEDARAMAILEMDLAGIDRQQDFEHFLENQDEFWHVSVCENDQGKLDGFMASSAHPGCNMIGPGVARAVPVAAALVSAELDRHRGRSPVMLVPTNCIELVDQLYRWGARNCELHFAQARGHWHEPEGIVMPTFLPESA